jgi:hypothetical protein
VGTPVSQKTVLEPQLDTQHLPCPSQFSYLKNAGLLNTATMINAIAMITSVPKQPIKNALSSEYIVSAPLLILFLHSNH